MQGLHYGKGLIYCRLIFRLTKLALLRTRAVQRENVFRLYSRTAEILALVQGASSTCSKLKDLEIRRLRMLVDIIHGVIYGLCCRQRFLAGMQTLARAG